MPHARQDQWRSDELVYAYLLSRAPINREYKLSKQDRLPLISLGGRPIYGSISRQLQAISAQLGENWPERIENAVKARLSTHRAHFYELSRNISSLQNSKGLKRAI